MRFTTLRCGCSAHIYPGGDVELFNVTFCKHHPVRVGNFERRRSGRIQNGFQRDTLANVVTSLVRRS